MNPTITHPGQPQMQAQVILASKDAAGNAPPIYTIRLRYPRFIHAEFMTHRVFGRNARSSRAVPVKRMIEEVRNVPVIPWHWGKNQPGMQAGEEHNSAISMWCQGVHFDGLTREEAWLEARDSAVEVAEAFSEAGYHKQIVNRLLEPFMWIDVLATATDWTNFLWLRDHEDAEPHIRDLAVLVKQAMDSAHMQELKPGEWHLPYVDEADWAEVTKIWPGVDYDTPKTLAVLKQVSAARNARMSYTPFDSDKADIQADLALYDKLMGSDRVHASPLEHIATPDSVYKWTSGEMADMDDMGLNIPHWENPHLHGNLTGWCQFRKTIPGENHNG